MCKNGRSHGYGHGRRNVDVPILTRPSTCDGHPPQVYDGRPSVPTWTSSSLHDNGRPHVCVMGDQDSDSLDAHLCIHVCPRNWPSIHSHSPPRTSTARLHRHPPSSTHPHEVLDAHSTRWSPTFRATTFVHSHPQTTSTIAHDLLWTPTNFGQPSRYMGDHGKSLALDIHTRPRSLWTSTQSSGWPRSFVRSHAIMWASSDNDSWTSTRYVWIPMTFCGYPRESLGVHGILWASTYDMWTAKPRLFWATTHISWAPNNDKPWAPNYVANSTHFGQPPHYRWSPTLLRWPPTILFGRPRSFMGAQQTAILDIHTKLWTATRISGHPREIMGIHITKHGRPSCVNGRPLRNLWASSTLLWALTLCGWSPTFIPGRQRENCGLPRI